MSNDKNLNEKEVEEMKAKKTKWFKISKRVSLPVNKEQIDPSFLPREIPFTDTKKIMEQVGIAISYNMPVLLVGETGTGKTSLIRHLAVNTKNAFVRVNHNGGTSVEDIVGRWIIDGSGKTVWVDGILVKAMKLGYWYLADEINAAGAEINFLYHSLLDDDGKILLAEKGDEVVVPHPNFRFFGAMNPPAEYAGTKELNKALLSRFVVVKIEFPSPQVEQEILVQRTKVDPAVAENMILFAAQVRAMHVKGDIQFVFSTRDLIQWATMFSIYKKYIVSAEMSVLNKISSDDIEGVKDLINLKLKSFDSGSSSAVNGASSGPFDEVEP